MPVVSVIVPVYNVERYLARCLDSVIAACREAGEPCEIVCVNDGATDSSGEILAGYAARFASASDRAVDFRVVEKPNGGLSSARNAGLDEMRGEWVTFVDSDDWIPSDAIAKFLAVARESGATLVVSAAYAKDALRGGREARVRWRLCRPALKRLVGLRKARSSAWNKFYRADLLKARRFVEGIYFEDWPFVTELFGNVDSFALVDEPMYVYCLNGDAASIVRSPFDLRKADSYIRGIEWVSGRFGGHPRRAEAMGRVALAVRMLVAKASRSRDAGVRRRVAGYAFPPCPLDVKTRFRLWRLRRAVR